jgi:CheY-like chemotaxis protein
MRGNGVIRVSTSFIPGWKKTVTSRKALGQTETNFAMTFHRIAVLVVEDEPLVRMDIVDALEQEGFEVFEAANADDAITLLTRVRRIQAMFTDIDMPGGMDGLKLAAAVRDRWPPITIIVTSGYRKVDIDALPHVSRFFQKPYNPDVVIRALHEIVPAQH